MNTSTSTPVFAKPMLSAVLKLTVTKEWFDLIKSGEKTEEYREFKKYWIDRLTEDKSYCQMGNSGYVINDKKYKYVEFKNGYSKNAPTIITECKGISVGKPTKQGSQLFKEDVFIISLGAVVWSNCG